MTALVPTRVSLYDFLVKDTLPIDAIFADLGTISLPQARIIIEQGIQAVISALLAYNQLQGADAVLKKLLNRSQIKELRKYNAFNFSTMQSALQHGQNVSEALFSSSDIQRAVCHKLAEQAQLKPGQARPLLSALSVLCLREIAILADFAHLDAADLDQWFKQQPQFLWLKRDQAALASAQHICDTYAYQIPDFDPDWHSITGYKLPAATPTLSLDQMPHYAKVIGRTTQPSTVPSNEPLIVDTANKSDILTFCAMDNIALPYQRWMLQLAKISEIYLSRNRLKIAPEPIQPPSRPFVNFIFMDKEKEEKAFASASDSTEPTSFTAFWKNPVIILLVIVIGGLGLMAVGKYQYKKSKMMQTPSPSTQIQVRDTTAH